MVKGMRQEVDMQGHDPGSFRQAKVIFDITNKLKEEIGQVRLTLSTSAADLDMHSLRLHEEQQHLLFKTRVYEREERDLNREALIQDVERAREELRIKVDRKKGRPDMIFLHRVVNQEGQDHLVLLSDSGATRTVVGKGSAAERALRQLAVLHNSERQGWVHSDSMDVKVPTVTRKDTKEIIVASGEIVQAVTLPQLQLGVIGEVWRNGKWTDPQTVFITCQDAAVSEKIHTTVWSETHFMEHNPDWTMIMQGKEKYMIYGNINMRLSAIGGQPPIKVKLRAKDGAHYLDAVTAVTDSTLVQGKDVIINVTEQSTMSENAPMIRLNVMDSMDSTEIDVETEDTEEYTEVVQMNQIKTEMGVRDPRLGRQERWPVTMDVEECRLRMMEIMRDYESESWEVWEAIEEFEKRADEIIRLKSMYSAKKAQMLQAYAMETRQKRQQRSTTSAKSSRDKAHDEEGTKNDPSQTDNAEQKKQLEHEHDEEGTDKSLSQTELTELENHFEHEYDKVHRAEQERRRQVRFNDRVMYEPTGEADVIIESDNESDDDKDNNEKSTGRALRIQKNRMQKKDGTAKERQEAQSDMTQDDKKDKSKKAKKSDELDVYEHYDLYREPKYQHTTQVKVEVYHNDKFKAGARIHDVSDFTLAQFLMENKVKL